MKISLIKILCLPVILFALNVGTANAQSYGKDIPTSQIGTTGGVAPVGAGIPPTYVGEVATRARIPNGWGTTNTEAMVQSFHYARQTISSVQVCFSNFYVNAGVGEAGTGGTMTTTASVEYPVGTFNQLKFSGSTTGSIPTDSYLCSDSKTLTTPIPNKAKFYVRQWFSDAGGISYTFFPAAQNNFAALGDSFQYGTSGVADTTMGGSLTNNGSNFYFYYPVAIISNTTLASGCLFGDSRVEGYEDQSTDATGDVGILARYVGAKYAYINMGIPTDTIATVTTAGAFTNRIALAHYCSFGINEYGINDLYNNSVAAATVATNRATLDSDLSFLSMYGTTVEPETSSTDNWETATNQTVPTTNAARLTFNTDVRDGIGTELNYIDLAHMVDPNDTGKWPVTGTANACTPDGIHENSTSAQLVNNGNICGPYINPFSNIDFGLH